MIEKSLDYGGGARSQVNLGDRLPANSAALTYSAKEAADLIGISYWTTLRLVKRGKLRAISSIRFKRIPRSEIDRFLRDSLTD
jgi:excisionase family DNA binding protein